MARTEPATPAQAVLALYGALDQAASGGNADIEATVARYLPGSTGNNAGWYDELLVYLGHRESHFAATVPDLGLALSVLHRSRRRRHRSRSRRRRHRSSSRRRRHRSSRRRRHPSSCRRKPARKMPRRRRAAAEPLPLRPKNRGRCPRFKKHEACTQLRRSASYQAGIYRTCWGTTGNRALTGGSTWFAATMAGCSTTCGLI